MSGYVAKSDVLSVTRILQSKMDNSGARTLENVIGAVADMVEADVVPVVRCKDCLFFETGVDCGWCNDWDHKTIENGFCHAVKKKVTE